MFPPVTQPQKWSMFCDWISVMAWHRAAEAAVFDVRTVRETNWRHRLKDGAKTSHKWWDKLDWSVFLFPGGVAPLSPGGLAEGGTLMKGGLAIEGKDATRNEFPAPRQINLYTVPHTPTPTRALSSSLPSSSLPDSPSPRLLLSFLFFSLPLGSCVPG